METSKMKAEYSVWELADCCEDLFGGTLKRECILAAFQSNKITSATKEEALEIVNAFMKKEVK